MDPQTELFLTIVRCDPADVLDIPADRLGAESGGVPVAETNYAISTGDFVLYFGKHKGMRIKDVPRQYLEWMVGQPSKTKSFLKAQRQAVNFLRLPWDYLEK